MPVIIKSFMGIFFFSLVVFLGLGIVNYQMDVNRALHYKQDVIRELQNSNFSPSVMNACMKTGEDRDYEVSIDVSLGDGSHATYTNGCQAQDTADVSAAYVTVLYKSRLPFLGIETSNRLRGFAR
ncbi:hypothetical protein IMSAGC012_01172 [Lachnospiraceae bacterium]|jgi:hypothetical protein|nr:hypothetical protein [Eubacterium sp.]MCI9209870.1 hypothetical protein [Eubacterium sp.]GFI26056.1 hypothetical protein IMSAGC012_01172 [Lachnospiraceae bacterium]